MVQKQAANSIRSQGDGFADDDPLAELARIVGFDQPLKREPVVSLPQAPEMGSSEFNLEDELMREFEGYEATPSITSYAPPLAAPEPVVQRQAAVETYEAPLRREEPSFEAPRQAYVAPEPVYQPEPVAYFEPEASYVDAEVEPVDLGAAEPVEAPLYEEPVVEVAAAVEPEVSFDLADELEFAVADQDFRPEPVVAPQRVMPTEPPRLRLPLANFSAQPPRRIEPEVPVAPARDEASFEAVSFQAPAVSTAPAVAPSEPSTDFDFGTAKFDWASGPVEPIPTVAAPAPVVSEPVVTPVATSAFDGFVAEPKAASVEVPARLDREEPDFSFDFLDELALEEDARFAPRAEEVPVERAPAASSQAAHQPAAAASEEDFDPFVDQEFDLQLDEIDLDLSDLDLAPAKVQPASAPVMEPTFAPEAFEPRAPMRQEPSAAATFAAAAAPVAAAYAAPHASFEPVYSAPATRPVTETYSAAPSQPVMPPRAATPVEESFSFDPSEISEQEDMLETLSGMDVPDVPVADTRPVQPAQPDYDIDIDAELATLFEEPVAPPQPKPLATSRVAPPAAPMATSARPPAPPLDDFDAFEKALEEDFRSTMTSSGALEPESRGHITIAGEGQGFRFRRLKPYLMAGTAVIMLLAGAGGLYAWLGSGAVGTLTGGEPQVIAADKSPVKIVPDDPGGKSVPNQDKAVYDRVAGNGVEDPKQPSLISSEEEPVDVVQRTLIPETLPMEGESEAMATPVGETEDPRLLPDGQPQQAAAEDPDTITPRKVRTMIVRPDGTLVAQEAPAEPAPAPVQTAAATPAQSAAEPPVLAPPSVPSPTGDAVKTVETRVVTPGGAAETPAPAATPAAAAAASATAATEVAAAEPAPAEPVAAATQPATDAAAPRAPIPTTRPADQPVNVVGTVTDQGNLRPAQPAAAAPAAPAAPAEVAAASLAAAAPAPATAAPAGSFGIQIASLPSEADAQKSYRNLSSKFGNVLSGKPWEIRQADIPGKGTFYRVRIVAGSKDDAVALCEQYRAAGGSCLVSR